MTDRPRVTLRRVRDVDAARLLEWRNDTEAVRFSVSGRPVTDEEHRRWFTQRRRADGLGHLWIAEEDESPVGQVRVDVSGDVGVVSIAVAAEQRGRGIGSEILRAMVAQVTADGTVRILRAVLHPDNVRSLRAFERAGFRLTPASDCGFNVVERAVRE
jgi:RimJ/RimL family protein N-acetyltransferase